MNVASTAESVSRGTTLFRNILVLIWMFSLWSYGPFEPDLISKTVITKCVRFTEGTAKIDISLWIHVVNSENRDQTGSAV